MRRGLACCLVCAQLLCGSAQAAVSNEARFFDDVARRAYTAGRYRDALDAFLQVNEVAPSPAALYNVAITAELAKRTDVAFAHYREYLAGGDSDAARRADAESRLEKLKRDLALVSVESEPPGATIFVDREELGAYGTAPSVIVTEPGQRTLLLKAPGREPVSLQVATVRGATATVSASLEARLGTVRVRSTPASARVAFLHKGQAVKPVHVAGDARLPVGAYAVQVSADGYVSREVSVAVSETQPVDVAVELDALPPEQGTLLVGCDVLGADVYVDGSRSAQTPATLLVPLGRHSVEVRSQGRKPFTRSVVVTKASASYVEATLKGQAR